MKRFLSLLLVIMLGVPASAQTAQDLLQQGLRLEQVQGDLEGAIALYRRVADEFAGQRMAASSALLRLGQAYELLGRTEAKSAYERILANYGDVESAAATARERLLVLSPTQPAEQAPPAQMSIRTLSTDLVFFDGWLDDSAISPDGRLVAATLPREQIAGGRSGANVGVQDWKTGEIIQFKNEDVPKRGTDGHPRFSPDGRHVAYAWYRSGFGYAIGLFDLESRQNRELVARPDSVAGGFWPLIPVGWRDAGGTVVAIGGRSPDQLILHIDARTGEIERWVRTEAPPWLRQSCLNASGRYIISHAINPEDENSRFLVSLDSESGAFTVQSDPDHREVLLGCSPTEDVVAFRSNRLGSEGLWIAEVQADGNLDSPRRIRSLSEAHVGVGFDDQARLYLARFDLELVHEVDLENARTGTYGQPRPLPSNETRIIGWSPDGARLATANRWSQVFIRDQETGQSRAIDLPSWYTTTSEIQWSARGNSLLLPTQFYDDAAPDNAYWMDADTGALVDSVTNTFVRGELAGGDRLIHLRYAGLVSDDFESEGCVVVRDRQTGMEEDVFCSPECGLLDVYPSPDPDFFAAFLNDEGTYQLRLFDLKRDTSIVIATGWLYQFSWGGSSDWFVYGMGDMPGRNPNVAATLMRYDLSDGRNESWADGPMRWLGSTDLAIHPDADRFLARGKPSQSKPELMVIENMDPDMGRR